MSGRLSLEERLSPTPFWDLARDGNTWLIAGGNLYLVGQESADSAETNLALTYKERTFSIEESCLFMFLVERDLKCRDGILDQLLSESAGSGKGNAKAYWTRVAALADKALESMYASAPESSGEEDAAWLLPEASLETLLEGLPLPSILRQPILIEKGRCTRFAAQESAGTCDLEFRGRGYAAVETAAPASVETEVRRALAASLRRRARLLRGSEEPCAEGGGRQGGITLHECSRRRVSFRLPVGEFALLKGGRCYTFPATELEAEVRPGRTFAYLSGPACIASPPYGHPFVYPDGRICHGSMERFTRRGLYFSSGYRRDRPEELASVVAAVLDEARKTLQNGYLSGVRPVHRLTEGLFDGNVITEREARERGIRVFR